MAETILRFQEAPSDASLVERSLAGDAQAKELLFRRYVRVASGLAFRLLGSAKDLEDVVQDSFAAALSALGRLQNPHAFAAWFSSIVTRTAITTIRRRRLLARIGLARPAVVDLDALVAPTAPPDAALELRRLYGVVDSLPTRDRVVLLLRCVEQLSLEEIAEQTGWSLATVKRSLRAAMDRVQDDAGTGGNRR